MEELRGTVWLYPHHPSTEGWHSLGPRVIFLTVIYPTEERESMWVNTQLPQLYTTCQRGSFLSCSIQSIESWVMWLWARRSGESRRYNYWRTVTVSWIPPRTCPTAAGNALPVDHNWLTGTSSTLCASPTNSPSCGQLPACAPDGGSKNKLWKIVSEHAHKLAKSAGQGEITNLTLSTTCGKQKRGCQHALSLVHWRIQRRHKA